MAKKASRRNRPNINKVRTRIHELAEEHGYEPQVLLSFAEFVNGGAFKAVEPSMQDLK